MRKYKFISIGVALLLLFSGCGDRNSKSNEETDKTSKEPPARKVVEEKTQYSSETTSVSELNITSDETVPFLSVTGNVVSISTKDITVVFGEKEYVFTINEDTKTYGGKIGISDVVTVTYEVSDYNQNSNAKIITALSDELDSFENVTDDIITETSTDAENIKETMDDTSENNVYTYEILEEVPPETSFEEIRTTSEATEPTTTTQDNSEIISTLRNNISVCEQQIDIYKWGINEYNKSISEFEKLKSDYEDDLEDAKIDLQNAMKRKVWVYSEGYGFQQILDERAVSDAQENVDFYEGLIAECDAEIEDSLLQISKYELEIATLESEIVIYNDKIAELS